MNHPPAPDGSTARPGRSRLVPYLVYALVLIPVAALLIWRYVNKPGAGGREGTPAVPTVVRAEDVVALIKPGQGGINHVLPWWEELSSGRRDGEHDPSAPPGNEGSVGVAWNVQDYDQIVLVFQNKQVLNFAPGGWYVQLIVPDGIQISPEDMGKILAVWLQKTYGGDLRSVKVLQ